jgi:cyclopropane-fatty-acyl-phospholipid synthase
MDQRDTTAAPIVIGPAERPSLERLPQHLRLFLPIASRLEWGSLALFLPNGQQIIVLGRSPGKNAVVQIKSYRCLLRLMRAANVGWAEGYLADEWDSPDVEALLEVMARNADTMRDLYEGKSWVKTLNRILHAVKPNTRAGAKRNIMAHYDLGNAFYQRWLDPTMTYSSAKFEKPGDDLSSAQRNKYLTLARRMDLKPEHTLLEIGCGWGGFAEFAAKEIGCRVTGITISPEQFAFARQRLFKQGLGDKTDIRLEDYRDTQGTYDRVASIEMFEAVGEKYWPAYFGKIRERLAPLGQAGLQIITIDDRYFNAYRTSVDFIQKYVFPGGMLPSIQALRDQVARAGLSWRDESEFGLDYAQTLSQWRDSFLGAWDDIRTLGFDERFKRLWNYYLSYCEAGFRAGSVNVMQISLAKPA